MKSNEQVARKLEEVVRVMNEQGANPFRAQAYSYDAIRRKILNWPGD